MSRSTADRRRVLVGSLGGVLVGGAVFLAVLFDFRGGLTRTALEIGYASGFFELQSRAFLDGRLWIPDGSMGIEGFETGGRTYMYFGPFPALLRIPVMLVTDDFNGQMTLVSMLIAWIVLAAMFSRLVWLVREMLVGEREVSRTHTVLAGILIAGGTGATVFTFDAALPWVYHEVYMWQTALVVAAVYWMLRVAREPSDVGIRWLGVLALAAVLTRTTGGWGVCLGILALAVWMRRGRSWEGRRDKWQLVLAAALVPLAIGIVYNMAKFGHPFMFPLEDQVWTDVNERRREALAINGGSITGLQFFTTSLVNYFSPTGIRFVDYFPWITFPAENARAYGGAFIDQSYRTGSVTAFMPVFLLGALASLIVLLRPTRGLERGQEVRALRPAMFAVFIMTGGVMAYGYIAFRYTTEFVPALLLGSVIAVWGLLARSERWSRPARTGLLSALAGGVAWSMAALLAVSFATSSTTYLGDPGRRYVSLQNQLSGGPGTAFAGLIRHGDSLPPQDDWSTDDLWIKGRCEGLYLASGDENHPWLSIEERGTVVEVRFPDDPETYPRALTPLLTVEGEERRQVRLETWDDGRARIVLNNETGNYYGQEFQPAPGQVLRVGVLTDTALSYSEVSSSPGGFVGYLQTQEWDDEWVYRLAEVELADRTPPEGITVRLAEAPRLPLCERIVADNDVDLP